MIRNCATEEDNSINSAIIKTSPSDWNVGFETLGSKTDCLSKILSAVFCGQDTEVFCSSPVFSVKLGSNTIKVLCSYNHYHTIFIIPCET